MNNFLIPVSSSADGMLATEKSCNCGQGAGFEQRRPSVSRMPCCLAVRCHGRSLATLTVVIVRGVSQEQDKVMTMAELAR